MERWIDRVALVTGASSGIGAAVAKGLVRHGLKVVGIARRVEIVETFAEELKGQKGKLYALKADITKEEDVLSVFKWISKNLNGVDILINNAAMEECCSLTDTMDTKKFRATFDVNIIGSSICTREAIRSMKERGVDDGHIININSTAGHYIVDFPGLYPHAGAKHAMTALTEGLRRELVNQKSKIRVTSLSPGSVRTASLEREKDNLPEDVPLPTLSTQDILDAIIFILETPAHVQIQELMIRPVGEVF